MDPHAHERKTYEKYLSEGNVEYWAYATIRIFFDYVDLISVRSVSKLWNETIMDEIYLRIIEELGEEMPQIEDSPTKLLTIYKLVKPVIEAEIQLENLMDRKTTWETADDLRIEFGALNTPENYLVWKRQHMLQYWSAASQTTLGPHYNTLFSIVQRTFYKKIVHLWREYPFHDQSADRRDNERLQIVLKNGDLMTLEYVFEKDVVAAHSIGEVVKGLEHLWPPRDILRLTCTLNGTSHELVTYVQLHDMANRQIFVTETNLLYMMSRPKSRYFKDPAVKLNEDNLHWMMNQLGVKNVPSHDFFNFLAGLVYEINYRPAQSIQDNDLEIDFDIEINDNEAPLFRGLIYAHLHEKKLSMMCLMKTIIEDKSHDSNSWRGVYEAIGHKEQYYAKMRRAAENTSILQWEEQYAVLDIHPWYKTNVWSYWRVIVFQLYGVNFFVRVLHDKTLGGSIEYYVYQIQPGQQLTSKSLFYEEFNYPLIAEAAWKPMNIYSIDVDMQNPLPSKLVMNSIDEKAFLDLVLTITGDIAFVRGVNDDQGEPEVFLDFKAINDYLDLKARERGDYFESDGVKHNQPNPFEPIKNEPGQTVGTVPKASVQKKSNDDDRLIILLPEIMPVALQGSNLIVIRRVSKSWNNAILKEIQRRVQKEIGLPVKDYLKVYSLFHLKYKAEETIQQALKIKTTYQNAEKLRKMFNEINAPEYFRLWKREYMRQNWRSLMKSITKYEPKNDEVKEFQHVVDRVYFAKLQHFFREHPYVGRSSDRSDYEKLYFVLNDGELLELEWCFNKHMVLTQSFMTREEGDNGPDLWPPIDTCYMKAKKGNQTLDLVSYVQMEDQCGKPRFIVDRNYQPVTLRYTTKAVKSPMVVLKEDNLIWLMKELNVKTTSVQGFFNLLQTLLFEQNFPIIKTIQNGNLGVQPLVSSYKGTGVLYNGLIYSHLQEKKVAMMSLLDKILSDKLRDGRSWRGLFHVPARSKDSAEKEYKAIKTLAEGISILDWDEGFGCYEMHPWWRRLVYTYSRVIRFSLKEHVFVMHILYDKTLAEMMLFRIAVIDHAENAVPIVEFGQEVHEPKQMQKFQRQFMGSGIESFGKFVLEPSWRQGYPLQLSQRLFLDLMLTLCGDAHFVTSAWYGSYEIDLEAVNEFILQKKRQLQ